MDDSQTDTSVRHTSKQVAVPHTALGHLATLIPYTPLHVAVTHRQIHLSDEGEREVDGQTTIANTETD